MKPWSRNTYISRMQYSKRFVRYRKEKITTMAAIFAVNNRRFEPLGDRPVAGSAPARPAYTHESEGVTYTLERSASGGYLMTNTAADAAVEVLDVDHGVRLIDEIEGVEA